MSLRGRWVGLGCIVASAVGSPGVAAQEQDTLPPPAVPREDAFLSAPAQPSGIGPGGAFWRSALIPGWGHASVGAYSRGAFYFTAGAGSGYMLLKSMSNRNAARRMTDGRAATVEAELRFRGAPEDSIPLLVEEDERVQAAQGVAEARSQQVQDWAALGIFILLLSGADAFVSAHLMDFPVPLQIDVQPQGRIEVGGKLPFPGPGG